MRPVRWLACGLMTVLLIGTTAEAWAIRIRLGRSLGRAAARSAVRSATRPAAASAAATTAAAVPTPTPTPTPTPDPRVAAQNQSFDQFCQQRCLAYDTALALAFKERQDLRLDTIFTQTRIGTPQLLAHVIKQVESLGAKIGALRTQQGQLWTEFDAQQTQLGQSLPDEATRGLLREHCTEMIEGKRADLQSKGQMVEMEYSHLRMLYGALLYLRDNYALVGFMNNQLAFRTPESSARFLEYAKQIQEIQTRQIELGRQMHAAQGGAAAPTQPSPPAAQ